MAITKANVEGHGIDWTGCDLVERIPGKVSGKPLVRGARILADTIVQDAQPGSTVEEIQENYPDLSLATVRQLLCSIDAPVPRQVRVLLDRSQSAPQVASPARRRERSRIHHGLVPRMGRP